MIWVIKSAIPKMLDKCYLCNTIFWLPTQIKQNLMSMNMLFIYVTYFISRPSRGWPLKQVGVNSIFNSELLFYQ